MRVSNHVTCRILARRCRGQAWVARHRASPGTLPYQCQTPRSLGTAANPTTDSESFYQPVLGSEESRPASIAIVGGGITGLTTAFYLSQWMPRLRIDILEASQRLGGWVESQSIDLASGQVVFEAGPRSLRPQGNGLFSLDLIRRLQLQDRIITTAKTSASATNRYIYYPNRLLRLPHPSMGLAGILGHLMSETHLRPVLAQAVSELFTPQRSAHLEDESIGAFFRRRFGPFFADTLVPAFCHGIWAGDADQLSLRALFPYLWHLESFGAPLAYAAVKTRLRGFRIQNPIDYKLLLDLNGHNLLGQDARLKEASTSSIFTLNGGLGEIIQALEQRLVQAPNVRIKTLCTVVDIRRNQQKVNVKTTDNDNGKAVGLAQYDRVVATHPSAALSKQVSDMKLSGLLGHNPFVSVMVVNLYYQEHNVPDIKGFGYLIPPSISFASNPEFALGVIFDSESCQGQDTAPGKKITVMLGGHWWAKTGSIPDEGQGASLAKSVLRRHLGIEAEPVTVRARLHRDCIPQYLVGHESRLGAMRECLEKDFDGRLILAGSSYTRVGINDCVRSSFDTARGIATGHIRTGLDDFKSGHEAPSWAVPLL